MATALEVSLHESSKLKTFCTALHCTHLTTLWLYPAQACHLSCYTQPLEWTIWKTRECVLWKRHQEKKATITGFYSLIWKHREILWIRRLWIWGSWIPYHTWKDQLPAKQCRSDLDDFHFSEKGAQNRDQSKSTLRGELSELLCSPVAGLCGPRVTAFHCLHFPDHEMGVMTLACLSWGSTSSPTSA